MARNPLQSDQSDDNPLAPLNPLASSSEPSQQPLSTADAWDHISNTVGDWLENQRAQSKASGLWDDQAGFPTRAGMLDAVKQYAGAMLAGTSSPRGIIAFHGSPYNFDHFDMSKIGTGEGAQAYGHGLYFAGNEGVARSYKDALSTDVRDTLNSFLARKANIRNPSNLTLDSMRTDMAQHPTLGPLAEENPDIAQLSHQILRGYDPWTNTHTDAAVNAFSRLDKMLPPPQGHMYQVNLGVEPNRLLDWDKPLNAQSSEVQAALPSLVTQNAQRVLDSSSFGSTRNAAKDAMVALQGGNMTGQGAYRALSMGQSKLGNLPSPPAATEALQQVGIPGIKYLDAGSRGAGQGTSNYVMFHPKLITILRKYGLLGTAGGAAAASQDEQ